ncbi:segregation and condensation protein A [Thermodesulfobacteriota bacterium]
MGDQYNIDDNNYEVKLEIFEGPLDLLLHLIRKNEVDIFDIPIAMITDQYIGYLDLMKSLNVNIAGDFLVIASTLVHIKSRMLLPEQIEEGAEEEDPRVELTQPLLEYLKLKEMAGELSERELLNRDVFSRNISSEYTDYFQGEASLLDVNLFQLMDAFKKVIENELPGTEINFQTQKWSIKERIIFITNRLKEEASIFFQDLFREDRTISEFIMTFLALLEIVHMGLVRVFQPGPDDDIRLEAHFNDDEDAENE